MQMSTTMRNARLDAIEAILGVSARLKIRTGAMPVNSATADSGTVLADLTLPVDHMSAAASGQKALLGTWQDVATDAAGLAGYYRLYQSDGTTCHMQGLCSQPWAASTAYVLNQQVHLGSNVYKVTTAGTSAGSGGPTGTGTGITDGSVTWAYVGAQELVIDNTNFAVGQTFNINSYTMTEGNP